MAEGQFDYTRQGQIESFIYQRCENNNENVAFEPNDTKNNKATFAFSSDAEMSWTSVQLGQSSES